MKSDIYRYKLTVDNGNINEFFKEIREVISKNKDNREKIRNTFGQNYIFLNNCYYTTNLVDKPMEFEMKDNKVIILQDKNFKSETEGAFLMGRLIRRLEQKLRLKNINRKLFDVKNSKKVQDFEVWPGYSTSYIPKHNLINIELVNKVITNSNVLERMNFLRDKTKNRYQSVIEEELVGKSVMTQYNKRVYRIDKIDYDKSPSDEFERDDGTKQSFQDYYSKVYKINISNENQPMLVHIDKKKNDITKEIYLVPELCVLTGLTAQQRQNRSLMNSLDRVIKPGAKEKLDKSKELIEMINKNQYTKKMLEDWKIEIDSNPLKVDAQVIDPGHMLFAKNDVNIKKCSKLDREAQQEMYESRQLDNLIIFYPRQNKKELQQFEQQLKQTLNQYKTQYQSIQTVEIKNFKDFNEIKNKVHENLNDTYSLQYWILPGGKGKGLSYDKIKRLVINKYPVPSQMILTSTISNGRNLRSKISMLTIQTAAKLGLVPWAIDDLPFIDLPTMVIAFHKQSKKKDLIFSAVATSNDTFSTYWSNSNFESKDYLFQDFIIESLQKSIENFEEKNDGCTPQRIIIFREGISRGQRSKVQREEVDPIKETLKDKGIKIIFVCVNKYSVGKFFFGKGNNLTNPEQGTYLSSQITNDEQEFFLISQKTQRGLVSPTSYYILENDFTKNEEMTMEQLRNQIAKLALKLCFMYYNTIGGIKLPAPIHYVTKLANMISDNTFRDQKVIPHDHLSDIESLFYIQLYFILI